MKREIFPRIIEEPARVARIHVDQELVARLIADAPTADSLPLLAFALEQMAAGVTRGGTLSYELYERLGGVRGAISKQAETALADALSAASPAARNNTRLFDEVIAALLRLVEIDSTGNTSRRWINWEELSTPEKILLEHFIRHRLLTTSEHVGRIQVGVAHEAFLNSWEPLNRAISDTKIAISTRSMVEQAAREWEQSGRNPSYLLSHRKIVAVETNLDPAVDSVRRVGRWNFSRAGRLITTLARSSTHTRTDEHKIVISGVGLGKTAKEYLNRSKRSDRRRRGLLATTALTLSIIVTLVSSTAYLQQQTAHERERTAAAARLVAQANAIRDTDPLLAIRLASAAEQVSPGPETRASLINTLGATRYKGTMIESPGQIRAARYSPNGQALAITGKLDAILVDLRGVTPIRHPLPETSRVSAVDFSPNGKLLAIGTETSSVALWNVANPASPVKLGAALSEKGGVSALTFSPDSRTLVVGGSGDKPTPSIWDVSDVDQPHRLAFDDGEAVSVYSLAFSPDSQTLAVGLNGKVALWTVTEERRLVQWSTPLSGFDGIVHSVTFSSDGKMLAAGGFDGQVLLWRLDTEDRLTPLAPMGDGSPVNDVAFSPDARTLAAGKEDSDIRLWDLSDPDHPSPPQCTNTWTLSSCAVRGLLA